MSKAKQTHPGGHFHNHDVATQVALAMPVAKTLLMVGVDNDGEEAQPFVDVVGELIGDTSDEVNTMSDEQNALLWDRIHGARAIGIALGLMLNGMAFVNGGAR